MFFNSLIISVQIGTTTLSKWMLPYEIILVLYFVMIIYFITNTGELIKYLKTVLFNMLVFIELFFVQKEVDNAISEGTHTQFFAGLWIYLLFLVVFVCFAIILFSKSLGRWVLDRIHKRPNSELKMKQQKLFGFILMDGINISVLLGVIIVLLRSSTFDKSETIALFVCLAVCLLLTIASKLTNKTKRRLATEVHELISKEIDLEERNSEKIEEKVETENVPFYLVGLMLT